MSYTDGIGNLRQAIDSIGPAAAKPAQQVSGPDKDKAPADIKAGTAAPADSAELSPVGGLISKAMEGSDVRTEKVQALQQAITSGSYHVPSSDIADKLIQSLLG